MAQQVSVCTKPDNLRLTAGAHTVGGLKTHTLQCSDFYTCMRAQFFFLK